MRIYLHHWTYLDGYSLDTYQSDYGVSSKILTSFEIPSEHYKHFKPYLGYQVATLSKGEKVYGLEPLSCPDCIEMCKNIVKSVGLLS